MEIEVDKTIKNNIGGIIKKYKKSPWELDELELLNKLGPHFSFKELLKFFPNKTLAAIKNRSFKLGIKKSVDTIHEINSKKIKSAVMARSKGYWVDKRGYVYIRIPEHPYATLTGYVCEHRLVMEDILGRTLLPSEVVHHINQNPSDNRVENLQLTNPHEHQTLHHRGHYWSEESKRKVGSVTRERLRNKFNHRSYIHIEPEEVKRVVLSKPNIRQAAMALGLTHGSLIYKINYLGLKEWFDNVQQNRRYRKMHSGANA